jgi:hypothetical protein
MITIVTDTTAGLPRDLTDQLEIPVLPQIVIFGEKSYRDDSELDSTTFLKLLRSSPGLPKTSAPPPPLYYPKPIILATQSFAFIHHPNLAGRCAQPRLPPRISRMQTSGLWILKQLPVI